MYFSPTARCDNCGRWHDDQPNQHEHTLHNIRIGHSFVATDEGVADDEDRTDDDACRVLHPEKAAKGLPGRNHLSRDVGRDHHENNDYSDGPY